MLQHAPDELRSLLVLALIQAELVGAKLWLVGGVVRDLLLGEQLSRDIDLAVEGNVAALAPALAAATGGRLLATHTAFGTATVAVPAAAGQPPLLVDLARTRVERYLRPAALPEVTPASLEADLRRRDFSVNAMALELRLSHGELSAGRLIDRFGGQADLAARRLRLLHPTSLRDDPTRLLRGLRLTTRLDLTPEPATQAQIATALAAGYLALLTPERVLAELCLALEEPRPDHVLLLADRWGATPQLVPGLAWNEALSLRCERLVTNVGEPRPDRLLWAGLLLYEIEPIALGERYPLPSDSLTLLRQLSSLRAIASELVGLPNSALDRLLHPFSTLALTVLQYAEPQAAKPVAHYLTALRPARAHLDGNDLRRLGVAPGPALGRLLAALRAATLDGLLTDRAQAERWVREQVSPDT